MFLDSFARKAAVDQLTLEEKLDIMKGLSPDALLKPGSVDTEEYLIFQKVGIMMLMMMKKRSSKDRTWSAVPDAQLGVIS